VLTYNHEQYIYNRYFGFIKYIFIVNRMSAASIANKSTAIFFEQTRKQKTPPKRGFYQGFAVGRRRTHCVTSTQKVYAIEEERAIPARILTFLSMDRLPNFVHKILFIHTVFIYTEGVRSERGGRSSTGATKSWLKRVVPSAP
jgi:hypothetical protein